jgi:dipeptidyl-peptidase-3
MHFQIRLASVETGNDPNITQKDIDYMGSRFHITRGDYSKLLKCIVQDLEKAKVRDGW